MTFIIDDFAVCAFGALIVSLFARFLSIFADRLLSMHTVELQQASKSSCTFIRNVNCQPTAHSCLQVPGKACMTQGVLDEPHPDSSVTTLAKYPVDR